MITCAQCGSASSPGAAFCGSCGASLSKAATVPAGPIWGAAALAPPEGEALPTQPVESPLPPAPPLAPPAGAPSPPKRGLLPAGTVVDGKYSIVEVLGQGGMGIVYLARDIHTGLSVVLKAMRRELAHRPDVRQRTLAEGRVLAQIDHPNVVQLKAVVVEPPDLWLVMQYVDGESLDKIIKGYAARGERMPIPEALAIFRQIVAGVGSAHEEGVIHRDLKPANVLVRRKDRVVKVTDFGIAKIPSEEGRIQTKGIIGSLWYMSPEQVTGRRDLDRRVDIYALGILLYQMLVGSVPFDAESDYDVMKMHAEAPMPLASASRPDVPASLDVLIQRMCAKSRDARFQSCDEVLSALERLSASAPAARTIPEGPLNVEPQAAPIAVAVAGPSSDREAKGGASHQTPVAAATTGPDAELAGAPSSGVTTGQGAALPNRGLSRASGAGAAGAKFWKVVGMGAVAIAAVVAALVALGWVRIRTGPRRGGRPSASQPSPDPRAAPGASASASGRDTPRAGAGTAAGAGTLAGAGAGTASDAGAKSPLEAFAGAWVANGKDLDAVLVGDALEFRVRTTSQFAPQGYEAGEARFVLRVPPEGAAGGFAVEDRIRPLPPAGKTYDPQARSTCQEVWSTAGGEPMRARFDGARLEVDLAKIEPAARNFVLNGALVTSCKGLGGLRAARVVNTLSRP